MRRIWHGKGMSALAGLAVALGLIVAPASPAGAEPPECGPPVPSPTQAGHLVVDPDCDPDGTAFVPLTDEANRPLSTVYTGLLDGAAYRIEKPRRWNGQLVLFAHGYRGQGTTVLVNNPALRSHYLSRGYAWAASSYQRNGFDVGYGVRDSHALINEFAKRTGHRAKSVYMTGESMGGLITAVTIETFPASFVGAMPFCGPLGDADMFSFYLDANVTAAALTNTPITFPSTPMPPEAVREYQNLVLGALPALGTGFGTGGPITLTPTGQVWADAVEQRSGGIRPGFDAAFSYWNSIPSLPPLNTLPFLFGLYPGRTAGTVSGIADGNVTSNRFTIYQTDDNPWLSPTELRLNRDVLRVDRTASPSHNLSGLPHVAGRPRVPVLSLHNLGDLFVPFSMQQEYARRAALNGRSQLVVSRAIRAVGHCDFTVEELRQGFDDLVGWVRTGHRPAGDDILNRRAVANPRFGCRFTKADRPAFGAACTA
jgi:pimeloyl-ACP methyl ester carboxylesterase